MGLLEKAQQEKTPQQKTEEESEEELQEDLSIKKKKKPVAPTQQKTKPQQKKSKQPVPKHPKESQQKPQASSATSGLLAKAQQKTEPTSAQTPSSPPKHKAPQQIQTREEDLDVIEEQHGFGWKQQGHQRIVFDRIIHEYRYEVIEPLLNKKETEICKHLSHLFKMLADIDTFTMDDEEKHQFLESTLENIVKDNDIKFTDTVKEKTLSFLQKDKSSADQEKPPSKLNLPFLKPKEDPKKEEQRKNPEEWKLSPASKDKIYYHLFRNFLGYGRLDILMQDDGIEDISCDGPDTPIFIHHRKYEAITTNIYFDSAEELNSFLVRLCQLSGKQISIYSPIVDGKLPDGSRLQATLARTVTKGSTYTIRKFKENPLTPIDLIDFHSMSPEMAAYFWMAIENDSSILFCGGTASGKTSALNALSMFIPSNYKIISIEDTREVNLPHKNWIAGTTRKGFSTADQDKTGKDIDMFDLIRAALRQRPRVIIVGEVRGKEAYSLFQAMSTGHTSYATVHASDIHTLIQRLENPPISLPRALLTSLDIIVFQNAVYINKKMVRRMTSVTEIIKLDSDTNQLIFMAPYQWVSKTDDRWESSYNSKVLSRIKQQNDWSDEQLVGELENRVKILKWMLKNNIRTYKEVGKIVAEYSKYPDQVLQRIEKGESR